MTKDGVHFNFRQRDCGECTACCRHLPIPAGEVGPGAKPAGCDCSHLSSTGCRIYSSRPQLCANFQCAWLSDDTWPDTWRPDRSGLLCLREMLTTDLRAALVCELNSDALQHSVAMEILAELQRTTAVLATVDVRQVRRKILGDLAPENATGENQAVPAPHFQTQPRHTVGPKHRATDVA